MLTNYWLDNVYIFNRKQFRVLSMSQFVIKVAVQYGMRKKCLQFSATLYNEYFIKLHYLSFSDVEIVSHSRGCVAFPIDEDPGNGKLSTNELRMLIQDDEGAVTGNAYICSTDNCNSAVSLQFSIVRCALLLLAAVIVKKL